MNLKIMILKYLIGVVSSLKIIHAGTIVAKIKASIKLGFLLSFPTFIWDQISQWGIDNSDYLAIVLMAIAIDHILGTFKHLFVNRDFSMRKNIIGICVKIGLVVSVGFLFEGLNIIIHQDTLIKDYLIIVTRLIVFLYPAGSAFGNSAVISGGKFPPSAWMDKLKKFQKNLDPNDLGNGEKQQQNDEP